MNLFNFGEIELELGFEPLARSAHKIGRAHHSNVRLHFLLPLLLAIVEELELWIKRLKGILIYVWHFFVFL